MQNSILIKKQLFCKIDVELRLSFDKIIWVIVSLNISSFQIRNLNFFYIRSFFGSLKRIDLLPDTDGEVGGKRPKIAAFVYIERQACERFIVEGSSEPSLIPH